MGLEIDYFLLYHGVTFHPKEEIKVSFSSPFALEDLKLSAVILMITRKKFEKFLALNVFTQLCQKLHIKTPKNLIELHHLQYQIIQMLALHTSTEQTKQLHDTFQYLRNEHLLLKENYKKLVSLFEYPSLEIKADHSEKKAFSFPEEKEKLVHFIKILQKQVPDPESIEKLNDIGISLGEQKFSLGITGVMNAGKSTMINALMGEAILGSSVVPETANLTVLKYNKHAQAKVHYWNSGEWDKIVHAASKLDAMHDFIEETNSTFGHTLDQFIKETSRIDKIAVDTLSNYTSVKHSGKKCNLIKYVELETDLAFLKDNVEIVDTPGLDDPVIQREEITKEYISRCDMLFHLMNVSQSVTKKDIEFLIDALLYQNISKLLIVITRADTVDKKALDEVIAYTKQSIKRELKFQNRDSKLNMILDTIEFLPISGKMALLCKTDSQKALDLGYTLKETGLPALENYMKKNLFGSSSPKSKLIIRTTWTKILKVIEGYRHTLKYELEIVAKSKEELKEQFAVFKLQKQNSIKTVQALFENVLYHEENLNDYKRSLEHMLTGAFYDLQTTVRQRVVSDIRYTYEKTKKLPQDSRITVIIQTAVKDGIIDIVRDYKYKLEKKFEEIYEQCNVKYKIYDLIETMDLDMNVFLEDRFKSGFLAQNNDVMIQSILQVMHRSKAKEINRLDRQIEEIVKENLFYVEDEIKTKTQKVCQTVIGSFIEALNRPLVESEERIHAEEVVIMTQLQASDNKDHAADRAIEIHKKIKKMTAIITEIKGSIHDQS